MEDCMVAHATLIRAALETACLQQALGLESQRSKVEHREWNYEKAREWFDDECWPSSEPNKPDFDRLAAGSAVDRAAKKVRELYVALQRYLSSGGFR